MSGWIKLHRQFRESPYYRIGAAAQTWIECLMRASHEERKVFLKREPITLLPGQFVMGREEFGASIGISGSTAWYWLLQFEADSMIDIKKTAKGSIVSVKNWTHYQQVDSTSDNKCTADEQQMNTNKNDKKVKNEKKLTSSTKKGPRPSVEKVMSIMRECFGTLDDSEKANRRYAWLLIQRAQKNNTGSSEDEATAACVALIRAAAGHDWWKSRIKTVETIYRKSQTIAEAIRQQHKQQTVVHI